jgi:carboxyl-terminal processing protease
MKIGEKMKIKTVSRRILAIVLLALGILTVQNNDAIAQAASEPERNFEFLWETFDLNYALFKAKHIDWQALYNIYRPLVTPNTADDELFAIMSKMLGHLNDNHVRLMSTTPFRLFNAGFLFDLFNGTSGIPAFMTLMQKRPAPEKYFDKPLKETEGNIFAYGWLDEKIGYFHIKEFDDLEISTKAIDEIIAEFKDAAGIVVDVRRNGGGEERVAKMIADRFADKKRLYITTQERNGSKHDDFDPKKSFFIEPDGPMQFTKTVILLTNRFSISAAENFALAMRILPHVTVIGDFTSGCFADPCNIILPNGWDLTLSKNLFLDCHGFCWEGIGVPPDIKISCPYDGSIRENDQMLETAMALIKSGNLVLQDETEGRQATISQADILAKEIASDGIEKAIAGFNERKANASAGNYYIDYFEMIALGKSLFDSHRVEQGEKIFSLASLLFPEVWRTYESLGMEYLKQNRKMEALQTFEKALSLKMKETSPLSRQFDKYLSDALIMEWLSGGSDGLRREYRILKDKYPGQVDEFLLDGLGEMFLNNKLYENAIQFFKLNVVLYPESANAYDSLGEAYMNAGNKRLAIQNYEKSLKLNPKNTNGVENLKKLKGK